MSVPIIEKNIARFSYDAFPMHSDNNRFCLIGLLGAEIEDPRLEDKRGDLLRELAGFPHDTDTVQEFECTIGGCDVKVVEDTETGRTRTGTCTAASYCLKQAFEASGDETKTSEERKDLYKEIMNTCMGHRDSDNAGNFCPRIDCGLSAGFFIDGNGGTAGECVVEVRPPQQQLAVTI